ncbi:MAG: thiamine phosphate synthase [Thiovulaceae bacterium]|nr:thiamine phosphate synthase [Sulfurimonadaceae bacterium]
MIKSYLITDPEFYGRNLITFIQKLSFAIDKNSVDFALYRDKKNLEYKVFAKDFVLTCKDKNIIPLLHQDYKLAKELNAFGVHLISTQFDAIEKAKKLGLFVVISAHTLEEIQKAQDLGADAVTFSPIFNSPNKGKPIGLAPLKEIQGKINIKIIALGGITTEEQINAVESCGVFAYASIRKFI